MSISRSRPRVAWVALQPAPYVMPLFEALHRSERVDIHFFFSTIQAEQPWLIDRYQEIIEPASRRPPIPVGTYGFNPRVVAALWRNRWDAMIIAGYTAPTMQASILLCMARRIPFVLQLDTTLLKPRPWLRRAAKRALLFPVLRRCSAAVGNGIEALRYWHYVGIPEPRTFVLPYTSHLDYFLDQYEQAVAQRQRLREALGIPGQALLGIFVGRLIVDKALDVLLEGLARLDPSHRPHLLMIGEGPERERLDQLVRRHDLPVKFLGFRQNEKLPAYYAAADFFVLPSRRDAWGVVVAEAMALGLPVVLSDQVGAAADLLEEGRNGLLVRGTTPEAWQQALAQLSDRRERLSQMSQRSRVIARNWTCQRAVAQFFKALSVALAEKGNRWADTLLPEDISR